jgi:hypothetical protein
MFGRKHWIIVFLLILLLILVLAVPVGGRKARHILSPDEQEYVGRVEAVDQRICEICKCAELSVTLKSGSERLEVRLGPKNYFEQRDFHLSAGDMIEVTGIQFTKRGKEVVLANEVRKAGEKLVLRGKNGRPAWIDAHGHTCPVCGN